MLERNMKEENTIPSFIEGVLNLFYQENASKLWEVPVNLPSQILLVCSKSKISAKHDFHINKN